MHLVDPIGSISIDPIGHVPQLRLHSFLNRLERNP